MKKQAVCYITVLLNSSILISVLSGCYEYDQLNAGIQHVSSNADSISVRIDSLSTEIRELNLKLSVMSELLRCTRADQQVQADEIKSYIDSTVGQTADSFDTSTVKKENRLLTVKPDSAAIHDREQESRSLFKLAVADFTKGRHSVSQAGFEDILRRLGDTEPAQESLYWLAECRYAQKMKAEALKTYWDYIQRHPSGSRLCPSLFKIGLIYNSEGNTRNRNEAWNLLIKSCPGTEESVIAESRLKTAE
jgi:TolA-binding protein